MSSQKNRSSLLAQDSSSQLVRQTAIRGAISRLVRTPEREPAGTFSMTKTELPMAKHVSRESVRSFQPGARFLSDESQFNQIGDVEGNFREEFPSH